MNDFALCFIFINMSVNYVRVSNFYHLRAYALLFIAFNAIAEVGSGVFLLFFLVI